MTDINENVEHTLEQGVESVKTDKVRTANRIPDIVISQSGGTITAEGPDSTVDSGTDAERIFESAIANLPSVGGTIYIGPGKYEIPGKIDLTDNLRIFGAGLNTEIVKPDSTDFSNIFDAENAYSNIEMANFYMDLNATSDFFSGIKITNGTNIHLHDLYIEDSNGDSSRTNSRTIMGFNLGECENVSIHDNVMMRTQIKADRGSGGSEINIRANYIYRPNKIGISCVTGSNGGTMTDVVITGNIIIGAQEWGLFVGPDGQSVDNTTLKRFEIANNVISGSVEEGGIIAQGNGSETVDGLSIDGNSITTTGSNASIRTFLSTSISTNYISNDNDRAITANGGFTQIVDNTFDESRAVYIGKEADIRSNVFYNPISGSAIKLAETTSGANKVTVANNLFDSIASGSFGEIIVFQSSTDPEFKLLNNSFVNRDGISDMENILDSAQADGSPKFVIKGNVVESDAGGMIFGSETIAVNNHGVPASSSEPTNAYQGVVYLDDGTNTSSGTPGLRYYDGSAWVDL